MKYLALVLFLAALHTMSFAIGIDSDGLAFGLAMCASLMTVMALTLVIGKS